MGNKYHVPVILIIISLLAGILAWKMGSAKSALAKSALTEQTLLAIEDCVARSPGEWPDEWRQEYLETIRRAVELHRDAPHYAVRLEILRKGFAPCWEDLTKNTDRSLFEIYCARIRWYVEHLMGTEFPTEDERLKLRNQYTEIWDYAACSLVAQFPDLDPNAVQTAKAEDMSLCYGKIDAPLLPVYLRPLSTEHVAHIKLRWDKLHNARADLWLQLGSGSKPPYKDSRTTISDTERDYQLTKKSLSQLLGLVWMVVPQRPDYYLNALKNRTMALEQRLQTKSKARSDQLRLEKERSRQLLQTEHISFLLACLLETPQGIEGGPPPIITQEQRPLEQQERPAKGGGAYGVDNTSSEK